MSDGGQPTQELPSWLSQSVSPVTDEQGQTVGFVTSIVYLPIPYYGPSIPLGTVYTFLGSSSPPPTQTTSITTNTQTTQSQTTATPTSSSSSTNPTSSTTASSSTSGSSSSSSSPSSSSSIAITSSSATTSQSPSASAVPNPPSQASNSLRKDQVIGIIVGSILGLFFILLVAGFTWWCLARKRRKNRGIREEEFVWVSPSDARGSSAEDMTQHAGMGVVGAAGAARGIHREMGDGSPRHSGEEADPFLQPRSSGPINSNSQSSRATSSTGSGYGTVLESPHGSLGTFHNEPPRSFANGESMIYTGPRHILPPKELLARLEEEPSIQETDEGVALLPPPRLINHSNSSSSGDARRFSLNSGRSTGQGSHEESTLETALRVRAEDLPSASPNNSPNASRRFSLLPQITGLGASALGMGLGWFHAGSGSGSSRNSYAAVRDEEKGSHPSTSPAGTFGQSRGLAPPSAYHAVPNGDRPISTVSSTGDTVYHSYSSSSGSGSGRSSDNNGVREPPKARANEMGVMGYWRSGTTGGNVLGSGVGMGGSSSGSGSAGYGTASSGNTNNTNFSYQSNTNTSNNAPPSYSTHVTSRSFSSSPFFLAGSDPTPRTRRSTPDILDTPIPRTAPSFSSLKSSSTNEEKKEFPVPPGLTIVELPSKTSDPSLRERSRSQKVLVDPLHRDSLPNAFTSQDSPSTPASTDNLDELDERPPVAGEGWAKIVRTISGGEDAETGESKAAEPKTEDGKKAPETGKRSTFGMASAVQAPATALNAHHYARSEMGSIHHPSAQHSHEGSNSSGSKKSVHSHTASFSTSSKSGKSSFSASIRAFSPTLGPGAQGGRRQENSSSSGIPEALIPSRT